MPTPAQPGLIVLMLDGISADYVRDHPQRLPHLSALMRRGFSVERLQSEVPGTSLPGRTSILTGATADLSGVYGNSVWDGQQWRYASPDDVRVPTLPQRALEAGLDVAVIGFGMVRPEDAHVFHHPWWAGAFVQRARDALPVAGHSGWERAAGHIDLTGRLNAALEAAGHEPYAQALAGVNDPLMTGLLADRWVFDAVAALALSDRAPDVIFAELLITDTLQHKTGYASPISHWSMAYADAQLGGLLERLRAAELEDAYTLAVLSDHGHSAIQTAIFPEVVIPNTRFSSEGSTLHVVPRDAAEAQTIIAALTAVGAELYSSDHIPADYRSEILTFVAPDGVAFEYDATLPALSATGPARTTSSHGLKPGLPGDDRFAVFAGRNVAAGRAATASAAQVAPTLAALIGLDTAPYKAAGLF